MASQVTAQCFIQQETGFLIDKTGNKLQAKSMVMCQSTPYIVTEEGDINHFAGGKMENIYHGDDKYSNFLEEQVNKLKAEKSQHFLGNMFRALTGSRWRIKHRQLTGIPPMPITLELIPVTDMEVIPATTPPAPSETEQINPEQSVPVPLVEVQMQPRMDNRLGCSYITEP